MSGETLPFTREQFDKAGPWAQGYVCYMQAAWNPNVPDKNPYKDGEPEHEQFKRGSFQAMLDVQDGEE